MASQIKEYWKEHAKTMENMRRRRIWQFKQVISELRNLGFEVVEVTRHQYRINDALDIFPANRMYHDRVGRKRGRIDKQDVRSFIRQYFGLKI
jgi:predicted glycosyltransferase